MRIVGRYISWEYFLLHDLCSTFSIQELPSCTVVLQGGCCSDRKWKGTWPIEALQHGEFRELEGDYPGWKLSRKETRAQTRGRPQGSSDLWDRSYHLLQTMTLQGISLLIMGVFTTSKDRVTQVLSLGLDSPAQIICWAVTSAWPEGKTAAPLYHWFLLSGTSVTVEYCPAVTIAVVLLAHVVIRIPKWWAE